MVTRYFKRDANFTCSHLVDWFFILTHSCPRLVIITYSIIQNIYTHLILSSFYAMYKACKQKNKPFIKTMLVQNFPIATYIISLYLWVMSPYSTILSHRHFILFSVTTGIVFGRMATKVILAHLTKSKFPTFTVLLIPLIVGAALTNIPLFSSM